MGTHLQEEPWIGGDFLNLDRKLEGLSNEQDSRDEEPPNKKMKLDIEFSDRNKNLFPNKNEILSKSSAGPYQWDENSSSSIDNLMFDSDSNSCSNLIQKAESKLIGKSDSNSLENTDSKLIGKTNSNIKEVGKERLVLKLKKITEGYFMVDRIQSKDPDLKFFNYESERYSFQVYVDDLPKTYKCKLCDKVFHKIASLTFHKRTHSKLPQGYNVGDFAKRFSNHAGPIEPYMPAAHNELIAKLVPHPTDYPGYFNIPSILPHLKMGSTTTFQEDTFFVGDMIGEGGFAKVYGAIWENGPVEERDSVLKIQAPANDWEWYILNQVHFKYDALQHPLKEAMDWKGGFMSTPRCYNFYGGSILVSKHQKMGTLLDLVNLTKTGDKSIIEPIAIYLIAELLGLLEILHSMDIVHADIKPDNFLLRHTPGAFGGPSLQLIDFGKAIDMNIESEEKEPGRGENKYYSFDEEDERDDSELTEEEREDREIERNEREVEDKQNALFTDVGKVANYHLDYYGIAGCAYCLLFGKYIDVGIVKNKWVVKGIFQRRWQTRLWLQFFDDMLNPKREMENLPSLLKWRQRFTDLLKIGEVREGLEKAREYIDAKILAKMRRTL